MWSENNVYFFYTVGYIAKVYIFGAILQYSQLRNTTQNLFIPTSNLFSPHFHKKSKNSTIEALWGTVISPLPKKGTVQYSAENTVPLDTLLTNLRHLFYGERGYFLATSNLTRGILCDVSSRENIMTPLFQWYMTKNVNSNLIMIWYRPICFLNTIKSIYFSKAEIISFYLIQ